MPAISLLYQAALDLPPAVTRIINAHSDPALSTLAGHATSLELHQHFKPAYDALTSQGYRATAVHSETPAELILLLPSKNKLQTLGWMAAAMDRFVDDGRLIVACANHHGAKSYEKALQTLAGNLGSSSKSKCRIFSARKRDTLDSELLAEWRSHNQPRIVDSLGLVSQPGLFSWDRPDIGSHLLLEHLPPLSGIGMDLCCGYGLLAEHLLRQGDNAIERLHLIDADHLALDCARENCRPWHKHIETHWLDAAAEALPTGMRWIVCNPPFHTGQQRDIELGQRIVNNACRSLARQGELWLVANRKLPYEQVLSAGLAHFEVCCEQEGFKIIKGVAR